MSFNVIYADYLQRSVET